MLKRGTTLKTTINNYNINARQRLGVKMRKLRELAGKTQEEVAEGIGCSHVHICRVENGIKGLSPKLLKKASDFFGVDPLFLKSEVDIPEDKYEFIINVFKLINKPKETENFSAISKLVAIDAQE